MEYDSGSLKSEHGSSRWRREKNDDTQKSETKKPVTLGQPLRKGKNLPVGVTSPNTHTPTGTTTQKGGVGGIIVVMFKKILGFCPLCMVKLKWFSKISAIGLWHNLLDHQLKCAVNPAKG